MSLYDTMTVDVPEGELDGLAVERFTVPERDVQNAMEGWKYGRATAPGTYTRLTLDGQLWMSDVDAEKRDHLEPLWKMQERKAERVLINGLGLGMVLKATLTMDHVKHVDVVEIDERVVKLVGEHYAADPRVHLHTADAFEQARQWPPGTRWDVAWSDIWPELVTTNLPEMTKLSRSYGRRTDWHGCWGREFLKRQYVHEQAEERRYAALASMFRRRTTESADEY